MAKFLPFVVEKSTPLHVFQTLVTRSKGLNDVLVASIFYLVVEKGITEVRKAAAELPAMDQDKLYEALINAYPKYRISNEQFTKMQLMKDHVELWHSEDISGELKEYGMSDIMTFLLVMILIDKLKDYTSLALDLIFTEEADAVENALIAHDLFSSDGEAYYFNSKVDVQAYVWCHALIAPRGENVKSVRAVYYPTSNGKKKKPNAKRPKPAKKKGPFDDEYGQSVPPGGRGSSKKSKQNGTPPSKKPKPGTKFGKSPIPPDAMPDNPDNDMPYPSTDSGGIPAEDWADKLPSFDKKKFDEQEAKRQPHTDWKDGTEPYDEDYS